jgi:hypothetical protein
MAGIEPEQVIASRRWEQALFTTYSLSLTFFESILLRSLRVSGCRDIWIITDAEGYRSSLMERRSSRVGQEYRLLPVGLPAGVFHPKCCYLAGQDGDLLLVGSGNLTFGGYGRNLEVLEILEPASAAAAFEDFARFLEAFQAREDLVIPERSWAGTFAAHARKAARAGTTAPVQRHPRLIHTVSRPAVDQIGEVCAANGGGKQLFVLSPFHDLDGDSVRELAEKTGCTDVAVGISPHEGDPSPFPFKKAKAWNKALRAVRPDLPDEARGLHAKWIEVTLPAARMTVTGSLNATRPALCSTDNVEVGVLRVEPLPSGYVQWRSVATPEEFVTPKRRPGGMGQSCLVHASLLGDGSLVGHLLALFDPSGLWVGRLVLTSGEHFELSVTVSSTGEFRTQVAQSERLAFASSLQIELTHGTHFARGWIHMDEILRMPRLQGLGVTSYLRLLNREETEEDDVALLEYFAMSASRHLSLFTRPIKVAQEGQNKPEGSKAPDALIELAELAPAADLPEGFGGASAVGSAGGEGAVLERVLTRLRQRLISHLAPRDGLRVERHTSALVVDEGDVEGGSGTTPQRELLKNLAMFDEQMRLLSSQADSPAERSAAFVVWFEVSMHMLLDRLEDRASAAEFLKKWLYEACAEPRLKLQVDALEQHVFTSAALIPLISVGDEELPALRSRLHGALERFVGGNVDPDRARSALLVDRRFTFANRMLDQPIVELRGSLEAILATRTRRRVLQDALAAYREHQRPDQGLPIFSKDEPCGLLLLSVLSKWGPRQNVREQRANDGVCAHCHVTLAPSAQLELITYRVTQCLQCRRLTVRLKP